jgi:hypothetical protein
LGSELRETVCNHSNLLVLVFSVKVNPNSSRGILLPGRVLRHHDLQR